MRTIRTIEKLFLTLTALFFILSISQGSVQAGNLKEIPVKGLVNMIDQGADSCLPCKMMAPIMTKLEKDYKGKAAVIFIDVCKFPDKAKRFNIRVIPTQVFYDNKGREVYRHEGFMGERDIVAQLK